MTFSRTVRSAERPHHLVGPGQAPAGHLVGGQAGDLLTPEEHLPWVRCINPVDDVEQGGLAGAVGADESQDLPLRQLKGDIAQGLEPAETFGDFLDLEDHSSTLLSLREALPQPAHGAPGHEEDDEQQNHPGDGQVQVLEEWG